MFKGKWTQEFFFVKTNNKPQCLICGEFLSMCKTYNIKRHYTQRHVAEYEKYQGTSREAKVTELKTKLGDLEASSNHLLKPLAKKRAYEERRVFNENWTVDYFFIEKNNKPYCLICGEYLAVFRVYNVKRHYTQRHAFNFDQYKEAAREEKVVELKEKLLLKGNEESPVKALPKRTECERFSIMKASYLIAIHIAKTLRPFTDSCSINQCMESLAGTVCNLKKADFHKISLSANTISRRIEEVGNSLEKLLFHKAAKFKFFSIAMDGMSSKAKSTELSVFVRGIDSDYNITEEMASLVPLRHSTQFLDLFQTLKLTLKKYFLTFVNVSGIITNGTPALVSLTYFIEVEVSKLGNSKMFKYHFILHPEYVCGKVLGMNNVLDVIYKSVAMFKCKGKQNGAFYNFLKSASVDFKEINNFTDLRWYISIQELFKKFYDLRYDVLTCAQSKGISIPELECQSWLADLAFLVDFTIHLNDLSSKFREENEHICSVLQIILKFKEDLNYWCTQLSESNFENFQTLSTHNEINCEKYINIIKLLENNLDSRFEDFQKNDLYFELFTNPFTVDVKQLPSSLKSECFCLQSDAQLKNKFDSVSLLEFYRTHLPRESYEALHNHAFFMFSLFPSTKLFEKLLVNLKVAKNKFRTKISNLSLLNTLRIATTSLEPDIDNLVLRRQFQVSH